METKSKKSEVAKQISNAFEFIQKLYYESSYLIKEIEGQLGESEYGFQILKPGGYGVSTRSSTGLETNNVNLWLTRKFAVAFVKGSIDESKRSKRISEISEQLRVLYFRVVLDDKKVTEPQLIFGVLNDIQSVKNEITKFENLMNHLQYVDDNLFNKFPDVDFEDGTFKTKGKFKKVNLLEINSSSDLIEKVITPVIKLYEKVG